MAIVVAGLNHRSSHVSVRECFAFSDASIPQALERLRASGVLREAVILSTCNRVEIYGETGLAPEEAFSGLRGFLTSFHQYNGTLENELYTHSEPHSVHHLFRVACGLDSLVLGETEILGQLKKAYDFALQAGYTGGRLNKAFQRAFNVAKQIRTETNIQRGSISVGSAAVELAEKIFETLNDKNVMVIGAGDTSEKTARALLSRGAKSIVVTNRSHEKAVALAGDLGGRAVAFSDWAAEFHSIDIVISSTSAPHYVLDRTRLEPLLKSRSGSPLLLIDIAVPRDIDPEVNLLENVFLYNIDDLQAIADDYLKQRREEIGKCEKIIEEKASAVLTANLHEKAGRETVTR
jgi:glutamyl-tRNA reductase